MTQLVLAEFLVCIYYYEPFQIFVEDKVLASGQAVGLVVAETREIAVAASKKVKIEYENQQKPIIDIKEGVELAKQNGTYETSVLYPMVLKSPVGRFTFETLAFI